VRPFELPLTVLRANGQPQAAAAGRLNPVDADAAELVTLDERHLLARLGQLDGEEPAALAGPDHDRVVALIGHCVFSSTSSWATNHHEVLTTLPEPWLVTGRRIFS
jgi:hypothetical protein